MDRVVFGSPRRTGTGKGTGAGGGQSLEPAAVLSLLRDVLPPVPLLLEILDLSLQLLGQKVILAEGRAITWRRELRSGQWEGRCRPRQQVPPVWLEAGRVTWVDRRSRGSGLCQSGELWISEALGPAGFVASPVLQIGGGSGAGLDMEVEDG